MIPIDGCDPINNIIFIGGYILKSLKNTKSINIDDAIVSFSDDLNVSKDHIILSMDWLFITNAITKKNNKVYINEIRKVRTKNQ